MTYLWIALAVLREISSREPQCVLALLAGMVGLVLGTRRRMRRAAFAPAHSGEPGARPAAGGVTASVR